MTDLDIDYIKHHGAVRGGANEHARFFLHVHAVDLLKEESEAVFALWDEAFGISSSEWSGRCWPVNSRREFALIPALIRKALRLGWDVSTSQWDRIGSAAPLGQVKLSEEPARFWQSLALAQAYYRE